MATSHVAQKDKGTAIDRRTTRHEGYRISQRVRKRVEEIFGWLKTTGCVRKTRLRSLVQVGWMLEVSMTAYNLVRIRNLIWSTDPNPCRAETAEKWPQNGAKTAEANETKVVKDRKNAQGSNGPTPG
jgi:hypothetical protein